MDIYKVKNYKQFARELESKTKCEVKIKLLEKNHTHYQLNKMGLSLGVLCICNGEVSFAPFVTLDTARDDQYIDAQYLPLFDDFVELLKVFRDIFVEQ